ncbi:hypothetical protein Patl1_16081 [Pistacia atlantica]|uniref:Uncharacterized protein n=1 Tax=Pistacia atlantica TaxID=434234 RepID=A0ACC1B6I9_9ROSI|nr:hypothetical protein Patl1_16081 [Pistacia atlantica]
MTVISATAASVFLTFRVKCCDSKPSPGFGSKKDKANKASSSREEKGRAVQQKRGTCALFVPEAPLVNHFEVSCTLYHAYKMKSVTKQSGPLPTQAPILSFKFDVKSNIKSLDVDFEERLAAIKR